MPVRRRLRASGPDESRPPTDRIILSCVDYRASGPHASTWAGPERSADFALSESRSLNTDKLARYCSTSDGLVRPSHHPRVARSAAISLQLLPALLQFDLNATGWTTSRKPLRTMIYQRGPNIMPAWRNGRR